MDNVYTTPIQITKAEDEILKRDLITREISREFRLLRDSLSLHNLFYDISVLQPPKPRQSLLSNITSYFRSSDKEQTEEPTSNLTIPKDTETPLLRYAFNNFVLDFPFLRYAEASFWYNIQQFLDAYGALRFGTYAVGKEEASKREKLAKKVELGLVLLFNTGICTLKDNKLENEDPKIENVIKSNMDPKSVQSSDKVTHPIDIISVRRVTERGFIRGKEKPLFIIQSNIESNQGHIVGRTVTQIQKYIAKVHRLFPTLEIPSPPPKFKDPHEGQLYHEKNRIAFQAHLRILVSSSCIARSRLTKEFLSDSPIELLPADITDKAQREVFSRNRAEEYQKILKVAEDKSVELRESIEQFTKEILEPGGLSRISQVLHDISEISQLPENFQKIVELARVNLAATLYRVFCADENAPVNFHQLQQTHGLIPYRTLKGILKISNPTAMMKGVLDLFLAQPFGHASIIQRVAIANLGDSAKQKRQDIEILRAAINNDSLCDKLYNYVNSSEKRPYDDDVAESSDLDRLINVITDQNIQPCINHDTIIMLDSAKENLKRTGTAQELLDTDWSIESLSSSESVEHEKSQCMFNTSEMQLRRLYRLLVLYTQARNTKLAIELVFEGVTGEILKEILTMFYRPLAQVYKDANISDFVMEVSGFIDQLIKVVENSQQKQELTPMETLKQFTELVQSYEGTFYRFVHSLYRQRTDGLFQQLIIWFERIFSTLRVGLNSKPIDLGSIIDECINSQQQDQFKKDLQALKIYTFETKLRRYKRLHKRMMANMGAKETSIDQITSNRLTIPSSILRKYMKEAGLEILPDTLLEKLRTSTTTISHSADCSRYAENSQQLQDLLASSGIQVSIDDMLEMQAAEYDSDTEEGENGVNGAPGFLNLERSNKKITEPQVPYPKLTSVPNLVGRFMEQIMCSLNTSST